MPSENVRVESVYLSYLPENGEEEEDEAIKPQISSSPSPSASAAPQEPLRRPLNLGIATAAVNRAAAAQQQQQQQEARTNLASPNSAQAASMMASNNGAAADQPSRVQQRLRAGHAGSPLPAGIQHHHQQQQRSPPVHARQLMGQQQPSHQQQQQQRPSPPPQYRMAPQQQQAPMQRPPQMRPLELRGGQARPQGPPYPQQQSQQSQPPRANRPQIPVLQVTVPPPAHQVQGPPRSPFSSSTETLVGSPLAMQKQKQQQYASQPQPQKGAGGGNWSPSSSSGSSHGANHYSGQPQRSPLGGMPPVSPSIKNLQLQLPAERTADPENDRLSPAMPGVGNSQKDWWKRFSTVVHQNEEREAMAEKTGSKAATKAQSEWLDKQSHRQRKYRIWVGVIAFLILAAIGGGLAYHFLTKGKQSVNTQPTTHDFGLGTSTKADTPTSTADDGAAATTPTSFMPAPSAVPAGNHLSSVVAAGRLAKRRDSATPAFGAAQDILALPSATSGALLRQRSLQHAAALSGNGHAHAQRRRNFNQLD